ncbi:hypothetical protein NP493_1867g00009 [Ridgeia piscesae]|uniref:Uncharacterized protein n=1 Tax=Ridgeia piscesae TaxID=27915 RepID=A0AAD9JPV1_RIDPI|nr:hypothetical protein NP493_1867g00009 [Ridgeia piscesae]
MMRLFLLSDRGLTTQHAEPAKVTCPIACVNAIAVVNTMLDGTMALARTSGQVLANPDNMAVFCSGRKQLELQKTLQLYVYLQIHQPMADRKREW